MPKSALVAGGTGLVGNHLVNLLVQSNEFNTVKVLVREGSSLTKDGVTTIEVNYDHFTEYEEKVEADVIFCCLGTTINKAGSKENFRKVDFTFPVELAKMSLKNGSKQFNIITAGGANSDSLFFYSRVKGDVERSIAGSGFRATNIFRPSLLLGKRNEKRFGELAGSVIAKIINPVMIGSMRKYRAIEAEIVAKAMIRISLAETSGFHVYESDKIQKLGEEYERK